MGGGVKEQREDNWIKNSGLGTQTGVQQMDTGEEGQVNLWSQMGERGVEKTTEAGTRQVDITSSCTRQNLMEKEGGVWG